ncbi:DUF6968 family protein [Nocardia sp. NPDC004711]
MTTPKRFDIGRDCGPFGQPIASRELEGPNGRVLVEVGAPRRHPDVGVRNVWLCPIRTTGIDESPRENVASGVDSMDALQSALLMLSVQLDAEPGPLSWPLGGGGPEMTLKRG